MDYQIAGLQVCSDFPLPGCLPRARGQRIPDVMIQRCGLDRDPGRADLQRISPIMFARNDGATRLEIPDVATFLVIGGRYIRVIAPDTTSDNELRCFLLEPVLSICCHQRGLFPIQATAVFCNRECVLFLGPSGMGKTALAVNLVRSGWSILSDGLAVVDFSDGTPTLLPSFGQAKIWEDTLDTIGALPGYHDQTREGQRRYFRDLETSTEAESVPITRICFLERGSVETPALQPIADVDSMKRIYSSVQCLGLAEFLGLGPRLEACSAAFARSTICSRITRKVIGELKTDAAVVEGLLAT